MRAAPGEGCLRRLPGEAPQRLAPGPVAGLLGQALLQQPHPGGGHRVGYRAHGVQHRVEQLRHDQQADQHRQGVRVVRGGPGRGGARRAQITRPQQPAPVGAQHGGARQDPFGAPALRVGRAVGGYREFAHQQAQHPDLADGAVAHDVLVDLLVGEEPGGGVHHQEPVVVRLGQPGAVEPVQGVLAQGRRGEQQVGLAAQIQLDHGIPQALGERHASSSSGYRCGG